VHRDDDLVHNHLKEIEEGCEDKDDAHKCEEVATRGVAGAMEETITKYTMHCKDTDSWSLWAVHPAVDNFVKVHEEEIEEDLHEKIHEAMNATGSGLSVDEMIKIVCSDAAAKTVESTDLIHEHLDEIQDTCKNETDDVAVKTCEDDKLAGIDAQEDNISSFYTEHCVEHVDEDLKGKDKKTLKLIHEAADKFETDHTDEIKDELHAAIHRGMEEGKAGAKKALEIVCTHEVEKQVEKTGLIHEHLEELEESCSDKDDIAQCEIDGATNIIKAKDDIISHFIEHCSDASSWTLWAIHPAVDNFAKVHDDEMTEFLHKEVHKAMGEEGLESVTAAFLVPRSPFTRAPALPLGAAGALLVMAFAGMAAILGAARLARQRTLLVMDYQHQDEALLPEE